MSERDSPVGQMKARRRWHPGNQESITAAGLVM